MAGHRFHRPNFGSISTGTLKSEDLIESFTYELQQQRPLHRRHRALIKDIKAAIARQGDRYYKHSDSMDAVAALIDALNEYAPEGFYFGAHPGDGSDFGFWLSEFYVDEFDGLKVSDTSEVPAAYKGLVLLVNDHGNASLYKASTGARLREIWSVV